MRIENAVLAVGDDAEFRLRHEAEDLDALKSKGTISHWERSGRTLRLYLPDMTAGKRLTVSVRFYATAKGTLKGPAGKVYEYYRRHEAAPLEPEQFEVF